MDGLEEREERPGGTWRTTVGISPLPEPPLASVVTAENVMLPNAPDEEEEALEAEAPPPPPPQQRATTISSIPPSLKAGVRIGGKYELLRKVGVGAMGEVWAAKHLSLGEEVAIKLVMRDATHEDGSSGDSRFLLEARVAAQLSRKTRHIVSVTDHGEDGPYAYLVMDLLAGESLDVRLARTGPMAVSKVVPLIYQIARALSVAHTDGVVHRDLKPGNVFVTVDEDGRALIKILDFGIAKMRGSVRRVSVPLQTPQTPQTPRTPRTTISNEKTEKHKTMHGFLLGTPDYMSPEQAQGNAIDHRADVWALGVIAYHLLTGHFPFDGETIEELFVRLYCVEHIPISTYRPDLSPAISELFDRAFAPRIDQRFQSAVAFARALERIETMANREEGATPAPMVKISLPPPLFVVQSSEPKLPSVVAVAAEESAPPAPPALKRRRRDESAIFAAGVPSRKTPWGRVAAVAAVLAFLGTTGAMISTYLERDTPSRTAGMMIAAGGPTQQLTPRDEIPPPDPNPVAPPVTRPEDLPTAVGTAVAPAPAMVTTPAARTSTASMPSEPTPAFVAPSPHAEPTPAPSKQVNRSEVF